MQRTIILAVLSSVFGVGLGYLLGRVPEPVQDARVSDAVVAEQMRPQGGLATDTVARRDVDGSTGLKDNLTRIAEPSAPFPAEPLSPPPLDDPMADLTSPTGAPLSFGPDLDADYPFAQMPDLGMEEAVEFGPVLDADNPLDGSIAAGEESIDFGPALDADDPAEWLMESSLTEPVEYGPTLNVDDTDGPPPL